MVNTMKASAVDPAIIEKAQKKEWLGMFDGLDFSEGKALSWPELWVKLAPMRAALPPLGGYKDKPELSSSDSEGEDKKSFIQKVFDNQIARQAEEKAKDKAEDDHYDRVASLEAREAQIAKLEKEFERVRTEHNNAMALFAAEKMTTSKLQKQLDEAKTKTRGRGGALDLASQKIMKAALEKKMREEMEKEMEMVMGAKASEKELKEFEELKRHSVVNYNTVSDLDVLADAMLAA